MIVGPNTLEETTMDGQTSQAQEVPGVLVNTGPTPLDVLEARMTLAERELMDRNQSTRERLQQMAAEASPARLSDMTDALVRLESRLDAVRSLRREW